MINGRNTEVEFERYKELKKQCINNDVPIKNIELRKKIRPVLRSVLKVQRKFNNQTVEFINKTDLISDRPIVFAVTHIGKWDFEIINEQINKHFYVIASDFLNMNGNINGIFMNANGVIFVDEKSKEDRKNSELMMKKVLEQGDNMMIFPEGTWNLSENEIVRDTHLGVASIALEKDALILPIAIEQYGKRFVINMGKFIEPKLVSELYSSIPYAKLDDDDKVEALLKLKIKLKLNEQVRDSMATLKYEIWDAEGLTRRIDIPYDYWQSFISDRRKEWPGYSMEEQVINVCVPPKKKEYNEMLEQISKMKINKNNSFLFMPKNEFVKKYTK